jgi:hypothetical protein
MSTGALPPLNPPVLFTFTLPRALTSYQLGILRQLQAGATITEQRHKVIQKPYFEIRPPVDERGISKNGFSIISESVRRDAIAALSAHGLIERGAEPIEHDFYLACDLRGHYDVWIWSLTAQGKEWA